LVIDSLELVGAWLEYLYDDVWPFPWQGKLVAILVALDKAEHQIPDVEGVASDTTTVVPA
jgi:hypothetical protein